MIYKPLELKQKKESLIVNYINHRVYKSPKNVIIVIVGEPGTGKSIGGVAFMQKLNPKLFEEKSPEQILRERLSFTPEDFLQKIDKGNLKKGDVVIFDEPQINYNSREFYSTTNKLINKVLTTYRHRQLITIFCTPSLSFIDAQARKLISMFVEPYLMNQKKGYVLAKVYECNYSAYWDEVRRRKIRFLDPTDKTLKEINGMKIHRLSPAIETAYKKVSHEFKLNVTAEVNKKLRNEVDELKEKPNLSTIEKEVLKLKLKDHYTKGEIAEKMGLPARIINKTYRDLKKRGIKLNKNSIKYL